MCRLLAVQTHLNFGIFNISQYQFLNTLKIKKHLSHILILTGGTFLNAAI